MYYLENKVDKNFNSTYTYTVQQINLMISENRRKINNY